jgi:hypothetical protein
MGASPGIHDRSGLAPWRQGSTLPGALLDEARGLGAQVPILGAEDFACVITQDCDVLHHSFDDEPIAEALIIRHVDASSRNGNYWHGKNPRRIQFELEVGGNLRLYEAKAPEKITLDRRLLLRFQPADSPMVTAVVIRDLVHWVTKRYRRAAFPDAFNERVGPAAARIVKAIRKGNEFITGLFIRVQPTEEIPPDTSYQVVLFATMLLKDPDSIEQEQEAIQAFSEIVAAMAKCKGIELLEAELVPEDQFTIADLREYPRWDYAYLSLAAEPEAPIAPDHS